MEEQRKADIKALSPWYKNEDHDPPMFYDGDHLLVAFWVVDKFSQKYYWVIESITICCDEDYFDIQQSDGEPWGWCWRDVEYWCYVRDIAANFPKADD